MRQERAFGEEAANAKDRPSAAVRVAARSCYNGPDMSSWSELDSQRGVVAATRRLAAILAADVVGYSRLMGDHSVRLTSTVAVR